MKKQNHPGHVCSRRQKVKRKLKSGQKKYPSAKTEGCFSKGGFTFVAFLAAGALPHLQLQVLGADGGAGGNGLGDKYVGADDAILTDHRIAAQNRRARIDGYIVLDGGMAALAP